MKDFETYGRELLANPDLPSGERADLEAHLKPVVHANASKRLVPLPDLRTPGHFRDYATVMLNPVFPNLIIVEPPSRVY